jgi:hypothetical protein
MVLSPDRINDKPYVVPSGRYRCMSGRATMTHSLGSAHMPILETLALFWDDLGIARNYAGARGQKKPCREAAGPETPTYNHRAGR